MAVRTGIHTDLLTTLDDLVQRMKSASEQFDQGKLIEARMLALYIRKLVHHSNESQALVNALGLQGHLTWVDTAGVPNPKTRSSAACLTLMKVRTKSIRGEYVPKLGLYPPAPIRTRNGGQIERGSRIPFDHWWTNPVVKDADGMEYSRKQLALALADPDGADADPESQAAYHALAASSSLGRVVSGEIGSAPMSVNGDPVLASVRQISYEVLQSIRQQREVIEAHGRLIALR